MGVVEDVGVEVRDAHAGAARAHEFVQRLRQKCLHAERNLMREIFSQGSISGGGIVGRADAGKKQHVGIAERIGSQNDQIGGLENFLAGFVDVGYAARFSAASRGIMDDALHGRVGAKDTDFLWRMTGSRTLVGCALALIMHGVRSQNPQKAQAGRETPSGFVYSSLVTAVAIVIRMIAERFGAAAEELAKIRA